MIFAVKNTELYKQSVSLLLWLSLAVTACQIRNQFSNVTWTWYQNASFWFDDV